MLEQIERLFQIKSELGIYVGKRGYFLHFFSYIRTWDGLCLWWSWIVVTMILLFNTLSWDLCF